MASAQRQGGERCVREGWRESYSRSDTVSSHMAATHRDGSVLYAERALVNVTSLKLEQKRLEQKDSGYS